MNGVDKAVRNSCLPGVMQLRGAMRCVAPLWRAGLPFLLLACLAGCNNNQYSMDVTVPMFKDYGVRIPDFFTPGTPIPDKYSKMDVPVCSIPDEAAMWVMIKGKLGGLGDFVAKSYTIDKLELLESRMTATGGSFETLTFVKLDFKPAPVNGVAQPMFELGMASSDQGLGTEIVLAPPVPVDLVQIMRDRQANASDECPLVAAEVHGMVPTPPVAADVTLRVRVTVTAKGVFASIAAWVLQLFL
jgi:hypothetical protein